MSNKEIKTYSEIYPVLSGEIHASNQYVQFSGKRCEALLTGAVTRHRHIYLAFKENLAKMCFLKKGLYIIKINT